MSDETQTTEGKDIIEPTVAAGVGPFSFATFAASVVTSLIGSGPPPRSRR